MNRKAMCSCNRWDSDRLPRTWHATSKCLLHVNKCHCDFDAKTQRLRHLLSSDLQTVCMCFIRKKHMSISHISLLHREHWVWQNQYRCNGWPLGCNPFCSNQRTGSQRSTQDRPKDVSQSMKLLLGWFLVAQLWSEYDLSGHWPKQNSCPDSVIVRSPIPQGDLPDHFLPVCCACASEEAKPQTSRSCWYVAAKARSRFTYR